MGVVGCGELLGGSRCQIGWSRGNGRLVIEVGGGVGSVVGSVVVSVERL